MCVDYERGFKASLNEEREREMKRETRRFVEFLNISLRRVVMLFTVKNFDFDYLYNVVEKVEMLRFSRVDERNE